jgi:hypothetical protein
MSKCVSCGEEIKQCAPCQLGSAERFCNQPGCVRAWERVPTRVLVGFEELIAKARADAITETQSAIRNAILCDNLLPPSIDAGHLAERVWRYVQWWREHPHWPQQGPPNAPQSKATGKVG